MSRLVFLFFCEQICILMLLKSTVCNESACCYSGEISEEDEVVIKHCDLWMSGARCLRGTH